MLKRFNRFELKYVIPAQRLSEIQQDLLRNMQPDANGTAEGNYNISSLYYDTPDLAFMRSKREGIKFRRKLRIRRYGEDPEGPHFVEIKQRINRTTQKRRVILPLEDAYALCADRYDGDFADEVDRAAADEVLFLARTLELQPTCVVGYQRTAFVGSQYEPGLRVTFDESLWASTASSGLATSMAKHRLVTAEMVIMEVKANNAVPIWLANLLARHQCALRRYSKYCAAAERLLELDLLYPGPRPQTLDDRIDEVPEIG